MQNCYPYGQECATEVYKDIMLSHKIAIKAVIIFFIKS